MFDRFLARAATVLGDAMTLKGGLVLELRLERARTTRDVNLRLTGSPDEVLAKLQAAARLDLDDFLTFEIARDAEHPDINGDGVLYNGMRFRAECRLAGKPFGDPFGVNVAFGNPILGVPETLTADDVLGFAGMAPPDPAALSNRDAHRREAARLHDAARAAELARRGSTGHRVACRSGSTAGDEPSGRARTNVAFRKTHALPTALPSPPPTWETPNAAMAREDRLAWATLAAVTAAAKTFLNPVLTGDLAAAWDSSAWTWNTSR